MADERVCMEGYNARQKWLLLVKGIIVGFGAIMPGISGGTLCVAFGMYKPLIEVFSKPRERLEKVLDDTFFIYSRNSGRLYRFIRSCRLAYGKKQ